MGESLEYFTEDSFRESQLFYTEDAQFPHVPLDDNGRRFMRICIRGDERSISHLHFFRNVAEYRENSGGCLMLTGNRYYDHDKHREKLTKDEFTALVEFLKDHPAELPTVRYWDVAVFLWNAHNDRYKIPSGTEMPEYDFNTIESYKEDVDYDILNTIIQTGEN